ncbi:hypothetical protein ACVIHD_002683 [Bradyrhizobium embrapense]
MTTPHIGSRAKAHEQRSDPHGLSGSSMQIRRLDPDAIGMQRPVAQRLFLAEFDLGHLGGLTFARGVDLKRALANLALAAIAAKHVLHEMNDEA